MHEHAPALETADTDRPMGLGAACAACATGPPSDCVSHEFVVAGNRLKLFADSEPLFGSMAADLRTARQRAWIECYTVCDDAAGRAIAAALKDRAAAGVDCRLMYDAIGSITTPTAYFADLQAAGVQVHAFHSLWSVVQRFASLRPFNRRNHRKLAVIDGRIAYFGGMNLVDQSGLQSVDGAPQRQLPLSAGWRDVHVRLEGPRQAEVAHCMDVHWRSQQGEHLVAWPRWKIRQMLSACEDGIWFFDSVPHFRDRRPVRVLVPLLRQARRRVTVSMAYFIPVGRIRRELLRAARRGVQIVVIVPQHSDVPVVKWASQYLYEKLLRRGIRIFERQDRMLHSKAVIVDELWSIVGSCNLDPRSLRLNAEFLAVIRSESAAAQLEQLCQYEMAASNEVSLDQCRQRAWWERLRDRVAWAFRRWL